MSPWGFQEFENRYVNVAETLRSAMTKNPSLKVFVGAGYHDLATPFFSAEYALDHMGLDPKLRDPISIAYSEAGHVMYTHLKSLKKPARIWRPSWPRVSSDCHGLTGARRIHILFRRRS